MTETLPVPLPSRRGLAAVFLGTLLAHALASWWQPAVGTFAKYTAAIEGLGDGSVSPERLLDFSPLYLACVYLASGIAGVVGLEPSTLMVAVQRLLAAALVTAFFWLVARRLGRGWGFTAAAVLALDSHLLVYVNILEPEILLLALLLWLLVLIEATPRHSAWAGVLAACAVATRPTFLPVFFLVPLYVKTLGAADWRRRGARFLLPVVAGLSLLFTWAHVVSGSWRTPVMNPGTVIYEGNQPLSRGTSAIYPPLVLAMVRHSGDQPDAAHEHYRQVARVTEPEADVARVNALWSGRAFAYVVDHPGAALERVRQKLLYALHGFAWHDVSSAWLLDTVPSLPFSLLAAAALLGLVAEARHWRRALPFYVLAAVQLGVMAAFYVSARQRLVLLPALVYFAICALRALPRLRREAGRGVAVAAVLLTLVLALPLALPDDAMLDETYQRRGFASAEPLMDALRDDGKALAAERDRVVEALATAPWWLDWMRPAWVPQDEETLDESVARELAQKLEEAPSTYAESYRFDLAEVLLRTGKWIHAETVLAPLLESGFRAYRGGREPSDPRILQARAESGIHRVDAARELLQAALADEPGDPFALADLAAISTAGSPGAGEAVRLLDRYVGEADRRWLYGLALRRAGRPDEAVQQLELLAERLPGLRDIELQLSLALAESGRIDEAAAALLRANRLHPEPVIEVHAFADLARRWSAAHPDDAQVQLLAVRVLHQHGMFLEAGEHLDRLEREHGAELTAADVQQVADIRRRLAEAR